MSIASITIQIPQHLYQRLEEAATRLQKPVENLVVETLQAALPTVDEIPASIQTEVASLEKMDNQALQKIAESEMGLEDQKKLEQLLELQNMRQLTDDEMNKLTTLRTEYGRVLLRKARSFALLTETWSTSSLTVAQPDGKCCLSAKK